jgi:lysyl-tRNA synthetase class 2
VRKFFVTRDFVAIDTPSLVESPGMEVYLEAFTTERVQGSKREKVFLPTSPEFHLKKALCAGFEKIFEIAKVYRNNEDSPIHQNEFWMLEWYRAFDNLESIKQDTKDLISFVLGEEVEFVEKSFADLFSDYLSFTLKPDSTLEDLEQLAKTLGIDVHPTDDFDDLFFRIYVDHIEAKLVDIPWMILHSFPPSQAALARKTKDGWADRFEIYASGVEIANAFHELNNSSEQRQRFEDSQREKQSKRREVYPIDEDFLNALSYGMPPSGGIALGLDRLFMQLKGIKKIGETRLFPRY